MSDDQPWLEDLPDDWVPLPGTPVSSPPARPPNNSRPSSALNSPSRIPVAARRSIEQSPTDAKKRITRPCHFHKKEPPTPKYRSPKTPSKWRSPAPDKSKKTPKSSPAARSKQQPPRDTRSPLRSVANASSQQDTVQVRRKKDQQGEVTPEWRRRLVHGEIPASEQRDLFAPIGLESVFKPLSPGSDTAQHEKIPAVKQFDDTQNEEEGPREAPDSPNSIYEPGNKNTASPLDLPKANSGIRKRTSKNGSRKGLPDQETFSRTASGLEDLRNEGITPITFSRPDTLNGNATSSEIVQSALKQVTKKLGDLSLEYDDRPDSRASDSILLRSQGYPHSDMLPEDDLLDITGHSLPQDLSMGTQESGGRRICSNFRRGQYLAESFLNKDHLSPSPFPSQHLSSAPLANSRIRSSPPFYQRSRSADPPSLPRSSSNVRASVAQDEEEAVKTEAMPSSGSPLKLFGDHDTFTSNKLLRRMSQFERTLGESSDDEPVSPSEEARRKGESRGLLSAKKVRSERSLRNERPRSRNAMDTRISRFGAGQLDDFDFSDASPYEPKLVYDEFQNTDIRPQSQPRSSSWRQRHKVSSYRNHSLDSKSTYSTGRNAWPEIRRPATSDAVESPRERSLREGLNYRGSGRSSNNPAAYPTPKRRRTILRAASADKENQALENMENRPFQPGDNMSLLQKSLMQYGIDHHGGMEPLRPRSAQQQRTPTLSQARSSEGEGLSSNRSRPKSGSSDRNVPARLYERNPIPMVKVTSANEDRRKGSITTQDFLSEATKIMDIIRSKGRGAGGLLSLEELEMEGGNSDDGYEDESTQEDFVRPPSRDGVDMRKLRAPKTPDPRVLSHLRKFKESEDLEFGESATFCLDKNHNLQTKAGCHEAGDLPVHDNTMDVRKRKYSAPFANGEDLRNLSARSIPTASSQSSHAKGVLSSDLVSHLIPEQVNGLTYDRFKQKWVKERAKRPFGTPKTDDSENDPFNGIPDLSVDELQETVGVQSFESPHKTGFTPVDGDASNEHPVSFKASAARPEPPPQTRDGHRSVNGSSVQSKLTRYTSSAPYAGTRTTSWSSDRTKEKGPSSEVELEDVNQQARVVAISFSSQPQQTSMDGQPFLPRPISRIDEKNEDKAGEFSLVRRGDATSNSCTPMNFHNEGSLVKSAERSRSYSFHLSPLADFTVDQVDQPLHIELSYVAQRTHPSSLRQIHGTFALATEELVKHIASAQPFEPYWEHIRRLVIREKGLITLHKLNEFCPRLEELDVSDNDIGQVSGIPSCLRTLTIQRNCLSTLTAWGHLTNLQYLDVSGNGLESLDGFSALIHLRELNASDNSIQNIDGIFDLDGLLSLKLSNNSLTSVDFAGTDLVRLHELDLSHNRLTSVRNLDSLPALATLDLSFNQASSIVNSRALGTLSSLKLSNNRFSTFNAAMFPSLTLLYADKNFLPTILGLEDCPDLEILSAREQFAVTKESCFDIDLGVIIEARKVYLSSNRLSWRCLSPSAPLRSLQLFDVASCNIQSLPRDFALNFPNVKVLNLNFNSLTGIEELAHMSCVARLGVAGNRINRLRALCQVLSGMGRSATGEGCSLQKVDLRGNPLTVRFYPPPITGNGRPRPQRLKAKERHNPNPQNPDAADLPSILAELDSSDDVNVPRPITWGRDSDGSGDTIDDEKTHLIDDPYTLPPADIDADRKYLSHLDDSTRLRRQVFELMLYAGSGGSIKYLDGLPVRPALEWGSEMERSWAKLEKLGVLQKARKDEKEGKEMKRVVAPPATS